MYCLNCVDIPYENIPSYYMVKCQGVLKQVNHVKIPGHTMETILHHGVLKRVNHGVPYNYHTQYIKKHGLPQFIM